MLRSVKEDNNNRNYSLSCQALSPDHSILNADFISDSLEGIKLRYRHYIELFKSIYENNNDSGVVVIENEECLEFKVVKQSKKPIVLIVCTVHEIVYKSVKK